MCCIIGGKRDNNGYVKEIVVKSPEPLLCVYQWNVIVVQLLSQNQSYNHQSVQVECGVW